MFRLENGDDSKQTLTNSKRPGTSNSLFMIVLDFHLFCLLGFIIAVTRSYRVIVHHQVVPLGIGRGVVQIKFRHDIQTRAFRDGEEARQEQEDSSAKHGLLCAREAAKEVWKQMQDEGIG